MADFTTIPQTSEYKLMYRFGAWVTEARLYAETDGEAIHDADENYNGNKHLQNWPYEVALFCGNRRVKTYKEAPAGAYITDKQPYEL